MVAKVEPPRYSPPCHHVATSTKKPLSFGSPKLAIKTTSCSLVCGMQWGASSYPLSQPYYSKSGLSTPPLCLPTAVSKVTGTLPSPKLLPSPFLFPLASSKPLSINIIRSYQNYFLFGVSACASVRGLSLPIPLLKTTIAMDCSPYKPTEPASKLWPPATLVGESPNSNQEGNQISNNQGGNGITNQIEIIKPFDVGTQIGSKLTSDECKLCESPLSTDTILGHQNPTTQGHPGNQEAIKVRTSTDRLWATEGNSIDSYQSDEDSDEEHSEYGSDDDDFIQFSDESLPDDNDCINKNNLSLPCVQLMSICSSESGYFECTTDNVHDDNEENDVDDSWSDCCSEGPQDKPCLDIWNEFETQALSPMMTCHKQSSSPKSPSLCYVSSVEESHKPATVRGHTHPERACEFDSSPSTKTMVNNKQTDGCTIPKKSKKVQFKPDSELEEVHVIIAWDYAYRASRRGPWEQYARDRTRFMRRVDCVASVLEPCLSAKLERVCGACK